MWRFISALCIMSIVAFLGLQRGEAGSSPERPQWRSPFDGADHSQRDLAALRASASVLAAPAGSVSSRPLPPPADWAPPAEIAPPAPVVEGRSAARDGAPVWLPPAEIAPAIVDATVLAIGRPDRPSPIPPPVVWAPPAEIAPEAAARGRAATVGDVALVWQPPKEIAAGARRAADEV
jgi:hypothetical protein